MKPAEAYPELLDYIFDYCGKQFWMREMRRNKHSSAMAESNIGVNVVMYKFYAYGFKSHRSKEITDLVSGGFDSFKQKVSKRIFDEHFDELELNLCPVCGKIARTPWAKQCRFCCHDWH